MTMSAGFKHSKQRVGQRLSRPQHQPIDQQSLTARDAVTHRRVLRDPDDGAAVVGRLAAWPGPHTPSHKQPQWRHCWCCHPGRSHTDQQLLRPTHPWPYMRPDEYVDSDKWFYGIPPPPSLSPSLLVEVHLLAGLTDPPLESKTMLVMPTESTEDAPLLAAGTCKPATAKAIGKLEFQHAGYRGFASWFGTRTGP